TGLLEQHPESKPRIHESESGYAESKPSLPAPKPASASWASLPNETQVILLLLAKSTEIAYRSSTRACLFSQLKWFDPSLPDSIVSTQAGTIQGFSTAIRVLNAIIVGLLADRASIGRKCVLLLGLCGYAISFVGLAFSRSSYVAVVFQSAGGYWMEMLGLDDGAARHQPDLGRRAGKSIASGLCLSRKPYSYQPLDSDQKIDGAEDDHTTFLSIVFLPAPRASPLIHHGIHFGGGLGLTSSQVGLATSSSCTQLSPTDWGFYAAIYLIFLPVALLLYALMPFLVFVPDWALPMWVSLGALLCLKAISRTFTCPASSIILNNCVSDPSVLSTVNGVGSSITNVATSVGPPVGGWVRGPVGVGLAQWVILWHRRHLA
ncbi:major facilitator superfamily domain-containing protein, partial [Penicillium alfredii]